MTMTTRALLNLSLSSTLISSTSSLIILRQLHRPLHFRPLQGFRHLRSSSSSSSSAAATTTTTIEAADQYVQPTKHAILLERLRLRHLKETSAKCPETKPRGSKSPSEEEDKKNNKRKNITVGSFEEFGLSEEVMGAVREMGIQVPTEIQSIGIPAVLDGQSVVLASHTGSGKTLAYLLPLVQLMRRDEAIFGRLSKPRRPRAVVLCPTRELSEQVFHVAKSISHHARFRSTMVSGGGRLRPQEDSLNNPIDMVVGTPGRVLQHIEEGNLVYGDIRYLVLDEADTMFDRGFGPDLRKFLAPLNHRASKPDGLGFQTILVSATMTKAVQSLVDEEFQGIIHLRTSTLHKKIASARHDFIKLSGSENKLEALLQVLEPSLAKGNKVMVFCNTLNSSRAVDHFLNENQISTVNYHGEVPAEQRVENLQKFKSDHGDCPSLVCTDLAARGLDLDVDHVIMFDFPLNSVDYLHRTGRTARMGAKGKVTSLVSKRDLLLATRIEEALRKNESLESLNKDNVRRDVARSRITEQKDKKAKLVQVSKGKTQATSGNISNQKGKTKATSGNISNQKGKTKATSGYKASSAKSGKSSAPAKSVKVSKSLKFSADRKRKVSKSSSPVKTTSSKLSVVGFRGRSSSEKRGSSA